MSSQEYEKLSHEEHIKKLPETYIGSIEENKEELWYINRTKEMMERKEMTYIPGEYKLFDELIVNALDQYTRLKESFDNNHIVNPVRNIKITYDKQSGEISVFNDGDGITIKKHEKEKMWIPALIFGHLLTSSNYNDKDKKHVGGKNGYGAKLANIFSNKFTIETVDSYNSKIFTQTFYENMTKRDQPIVVSFKKKPYTKITYTPDYKRFNKSGLTDDMILIIEKRAYDVAAFTNSNVNVFINETKIECKTFEKYVNLYIGTKSDTPRAYEKNNRWEMACSLNTTGQFDQISFVNGIHTNKGGKHVDYVVNQITKKLGDFIYKKRKLQVKPIFIKENIILFINCIIDNPSFTSQTKECMTTNSSQFGSKYEISSKFIENLAKCGIVERVIELSALKDNKSLKKLDGKKQDRIRVNKLDDANWAGTNKSDECTIILTEGDSAKSMALAGLSIIGRDKYGVFPLKGKLANVKDIKNIKKLLENEEINNIKKILGLQSDKTYTSTKELRYGRVLVLTDQDEDGSHIKGLLFNLFQTLWPSLFKYPGFLNSMLTPIVKAKKNKELITFYSVKDFHKWKEDTDIKGYSFKYYKGLGTSTPAEAKEYFKEFKLVVYTGEEKNDTDSIELAFGRDDNSSNKRKEWLCTYNKENTLDYTNKHVSVKDFVNEDLMHFSNSDNVRSIPSGIDGLKPSQRKVLYGCFKRKLYNEIRVAQLSGFISEHCAYHHGEASLNGTIVNMAQNFVGSNNLNLLEPIGQFGSRVMGGKDSAQPRYIHTKLSDITSKLFNPLDEPIYTYNNDEGLMIEPNYYVPTLPNLLINGSQGIGTGWSTKIPQFNPIDLINNIKLYLSSKELNELTPWYKGFNGTIVKNDDKSFITRGVYTVNNNKVYVTELPIGTWTEDYKEYLDTLIIDSKADEKKKTKQVIKYFNSYSSDVEVNFEIVFPTTSTETLLDNAKLEKILKMTSTISMSNMIYYNEHNKITKADNVNKILTEFIILRLKTYTLRKTHMLDELEKDIKILDSKARFIKEYINGDININNVSKIDIITILENKTYLKQEDSYDYLLKLPIYSLTKEKIDSLNASLNDKKEQFDILNNKSIEAMWLEELKDLEVILKKEGTKKKNLIKKKH